MLDPLESLSLFEHLTVEYFILALDVEMELHAIPSDLILKFLFRCFAVFIS